MTGPPRYGRVHHVCMAMTTAAAVDVPRVSASRRAYRHVKEPHPRRHAAGRRAAVSEGEMAEELGMSRTPVRAAFGQLEAEGLPAALSRSAAPSSCPVSPRRPRSVMETRWVIERYAIERVSQRLGDASCARRVGAARPARERRASSRPTGRSTARSSRARATRSCSRSTTRCATASAGCSRVSTRHRTSARRRSSPSTASSPASRAATRR